jgi:lysophospholipase L1-like esterase
MQFKRHEILLAFSLIGLSVLFALGLAEAVLRIIPKSLLPEEVQLNIHWLRNTDSPQGVPHPDIGVLPPAHFTGQEQRRDFRFTYHTDGFGFRNSWPWPVSAEIVAVGDSLTFGYGVDDAQTWTAILANRLPHSRVVNLGLNGAGPQQYLHVYETFGMNLHPRVLLFGLFLGNDLIDARKFDMRFEAGGEGNSTVSQPFYSWPEIRKFLGKRSYLYILLREIWWNYHSLYRFRRKALELSDGSRLQFAPGILERSTVGARLDHPDFQRVLQSVERAQSIAQQSETHFLVLLFPTKEEVYLPIMGEPSPDPIGPFRKAFERLEINYLDLTPPLQHRAKARERLFFEVDGHPNAAGYALIAEVVHSHLQDHAQRYGLKDWGQGSNQPGSQTNTEASK